MKTADLHKMSAYVGNLNALFGMKEYRLTEGKATGVKAVDLRNGCGIEMTVLADKCMNIPWLYYKGMSVGFASKTGIVGPQYFTEDGAIGFLRQFDGGFLTTCGITYSGVPFEKDGRKHGLHGTIFNSPAENFAKEIIDLDGIAVRTTTAERSSPRNGDPALAALGILCSAAGLGTLGGLLYLVHKKQKPPVMEDYENKEE